MSFGDPVQYEPSILQQYADRLYAQADSTVALLTIFWTVLGFGGGAALISIMHLSGDAALYPIFGAPLILGLAGFAIGSGRAFKYRLEAQRTMCQIAIERNTRPQAPTSA